jgi:hypothetical protein
LQAPFNAKTSAATTAVVAKIINGTNYLNIGRLKNHKKHVPPRHDHTPSPLHFDHSDKNDHKRRKEVYPKKKKKNAVHNTTNDQFFSNKCILHPPTPSPIAQNTKTEAWKKYQVIKIRKKKRKKKQPMELATYSVLIGRKAKVEPHQFCQRRTSHLRILLHASQHHSP